MSIEDALNRQGPAADVVAAVAAESGASVLDLSSELCPDGSCSTVSPDGLIRYRDGTHITVEQSEALAGTYLSAMTATG